MRRTLLILDCNYLCRRAFYAMGGLKFAEDPTGALFGFFRDISILQDRFDTKYIAFCFDFGKNKRKDIYPDYKGNRRKNKGDDENRSLLQQQLDNLRTLHLPELGFKNVFYQDGHEADDIMAVIAKDPLIVAKKILVTSDQDMYQLLSNRVAMWKPAAKQLYTAKKFKEEYGIPPCNWSVVKAIAGCSSDNVKGVPGVGEKTAVKLVRGDVDEKNKAWKAWMANKAITQRNMGLVTLPFIGTRHVKMKRDRVTKKQWKAVMRQLGMGSLERQFPLTAK